MTPEEKIIEALAAYADDPHQWVRFSFPWGEKGTELESRRGPEPWQDKVLIDVRDGLLTPEEAIQVAVASGHGVGKSALVSWIILWAMCRPDTRGVVTANTEKQLVSKTWAELAKWYRLFIGRFMFKMTATRLVAADPDHENTWRIDMIPWSENNTEAFAGLHNQGRRILLVMDEASAIADVIWETSEGALTDHDTQIIWLVCGNPTRNSGRFKECFDEGKFAHRWKQHRVDSRTVSFTNKRKIAEWISDYGEDSDFVRVRIKGTFPRIGSQEFISSYTVADATKREVESFLEDPLIIGVDVARFGDDESVICFRKGRDARALPWIFLRGVSTVTLASRVAEAAIALRADAVFVDGGGVGGGVVDNLRQIHKIAVIDVQFGARPDRAGPADDEKAKYANKRAEIWGFMRAWLKTGGIPDDEELRSQLVAPTYHLTAQDAIQLEKKEDMKARGLPSPDRADALAVTFAYPVAESASAGGLGPAKPLVESEYNPISSERLVA